MERGVEEVGASLCCCRRCEVGPSWRAQWRVQRPWRQPRPLIQTRACAVRRRPSGTVVRGLGWCLVVARPWSGCLRGALLIL